MNIRTYGTDERLGFCREYLERRNIRSVGDIILLPIPTSKDGITVFGLGKAPEEIFTVSGDFCAEVGCEASSEGLSASERGEPLPPSCAVVGYEIPKSFKEFFSQRGACVVDVALDEVFLSENARLTAEGAVGRILSGERAAPSELSIGIIGYGRIGKRLSNLLAFLGARLTVFTSREEIMRELCMIGISSAPSGSLADGGVLETLRALDIIINTAPGLLISGEGIEALSRTKIIELASGDNFPEGTDVLRLAAVPARMYPKSAGRVLADSVLRMLGEQP